MSSLFLRSLPIIALTGATDLTTRRGYLVTVAGDVATLSASATVPARGVILEGRPAAEVSSIGILGSIPGTVALKASGAITKGDRVQQASDGTIVTDAGTGSRVVIGTALETGVSGDLLEVATHVPLSLS